MLARVILTIVVLWSYQLTLLLALEHRPMCFYWFGLLVYCIWLGTRLSR